MIARDGNIVRLAGPLTLHTVRALYDQGLRAQGQSHLEVDLSQVETVDSAAVSLMLVWLREAQQHEVSLQFNNVPENLLSLARLYGVADLLSLPAAA